MVAASCAVVIVPRARERKVTFEEYRRRIGYIGRAMNRCRSSYKRCLRFWQLQKMEENDARIQALSSATSEKQESHVYVHVDRS